MKRFILAMTLSFAFSLCSMELSAQNINKQPAWGPVGYDTANYYYMPDINIYYDVANALFYYLSGGTWVSTKYLPVKYKSYDLYSLFKVVINNETNPWNNNKTHKKQYKTYKNDKTQTAIRYSPDSKYNTSKGNITPWVDSNRGNYSSNKKNSSSSKNNKKDNPSSNNKKDNQQKQNDGKGGGRR